MNAKIRSAAHEAEAALRRNGDIAHALAVRKLLASHAAQAAALSAQQDELLAARRQRELAEYRR